MSEGVNDPHQEALGEVALARLALDGDDLPHCARHVAEALQYSPTLSAVASKAVAAYPAHAILLGAASGVARRLGEIRLALIWAQRAVESSRASSAKLT